MAFTREFIRRLAKESEIELPKEFIDGLMTKHANVRDGYAEEQVKAALANQPKPKPTESEEYKALQKKFDDEKAAHDKLKTEVATKETNGKKSDALKAMLKAAGYSEKGVDKIAKYGNYLDGVELDENGSIKNSDALIKTISDEWGEYIETKTATGAQTATPPTGYGTGANSKSTGRAKLLAQQYQENNYGVPKTQNSIKEE